jgi:hypothetical protein
MDALQSPKGACHDQHYRRFLTGCRAHIQSAANPAAEQHRYTNPCAAGNAKRPYSSASSLNLFSRGQRQRLNRARHECRHNRLIFRN